MEVIINSLQEKLYIANKALEEKMILYHGSNLTISEPKLIVQNRFAALKIKKLYNQLVLTSTKALSYLKFCGTVPKEDF